MDSAIWFCGVAARCAVRLSPTALTSAPIYGGAEPHRTSGGRPASQLAHDSQRLTFDEPLYGLGEVVPLLKLTQLKSAAHHNVDRCLVATNARLLDCLPGIS